LAAGSIIARNHNLLIGLANHNKQTNSNPKFPNKIIEGKSIHTTGSYNGDILPVGDYKLITLADAIVDRLAQPACKIELKRNSMRKKHSLLTKSEA